MHDHLKGADDECAGTNAAEDDREQSAVLRQVLEVLPTELTQDELIREMNGGRPKEFSEMDRVQRAIRELAGTGLLHRPGEDEIVRPTRAAGFHTFRHTFASLHLSRGTNIVQLSRALGHHSPAFTLARYTHLLPGDEAPALDLDLLREPAAPETVAGPALALVS